VNISGELVISSLYKGDDDENIIEFVEHEVPFNGSIDVASARDHMFADVVLLPNEQYIQVRPDNDGEDRMIEAEISVSAVLKLSEQSEIEVLDDAYIVNKCLDMRREKVCYPKLVCRNKNQCPVKEVVELAPDCPDILQIFRVTGNVHLDDIKVSDDRVFVEGVIETNVLYIAKNDDAPLYNFRAMIPFRQTIETKGAAPGMDVSIEKCVDHVGFNMLSDREMEIRFLLSFNTSVTDANETNIVTDIDFSDLDRAITDNMPSITVYIVQPGDTLWCIAKKYNSSLDDILSINEIDDTSKIYAGQKLLILKKPLA
jgi:nucleoid-associated protein YgaU